MSIRESEYHTKAASESIGWQRDKFGMREEDTPVRPTHQEDWWNQLVAAPTINGEEPRFYSVAGLIGKGFVDAGMRKGVTTWEVEVEKGKFETVKVHPVVFPSTVEKGKVWTVFIPKQ